MLMEWLEPAIEKRINGMHSDVEVASRELYNRLSRIIHETMEMNPQHSKQAIEIEEIFNEMLTASIDLTYRRGFNDCFTLMKKLV